MNAPIPAYAVLILAALTLAAWANALRRLAAGRPIFPKAPPPPVHWGWLRAAAVFLLFIMFQILALMIYRKAVGPIQTPRSIAGYVILMYAFNSLTLLAIFSNARERGAGLAALGLKTAGPMRAVGRGLFAFLLFLPVQAFWSALVYGVWTRLFERPLPMQETAGALLNAGALSFFVLGFAAAAAAPVFEELVFRGFVQGGFEKSLGAAMGVGITALIFTAVHGPAGAVQVFPVAVALGLLYHRTRSLPACIAFHCAVNSSSIVAVLLIRAGA